ncbi:YrdB family protein [Parafrigoribacterium mesophilum]|uniref:YrdB family protein n=1 Tax=Parafrigoribacterium mesophilum TaxID=433646 RepID=UPI0031FE3D8F
MPNPQPDPRIGPNEVLRFFLELFALFSLGYWGYLAWPFPWPGVAFMIGTPLFAAIVWGLFRSPRARFPLDAFGRTIVEVAVMGSAALAWVMLDHPIIAAVFVVVAAVSGILNLRAEQRRDRQQ